MIIDSGSIHKKHQSTLKSDAQFLVQMRQLLQRKARFPGILSIHERERAQGIMALELDSGLLNISLSPSCAHTYM